MIEFVQDPLSRRGKTVFPLTVYPLASPQRKQGTPLLALRAGKKNR